MKASLVIITSIRIWGTENPHETIQHETDSRKVNVLCAISKQKIYGPLYKHRGPGFDSRALLRIFLRELGLERGPLSLVIG
jgi:hypothetical protein